MRVKPAEGRAVRDPLTKQLLPAAGRDVPDNQFWRRRLRDGDVVSADAPAPRNGPPAPRRTGTEG
jgi:Protein of unknown function (DUF2635)